MSQQIRSAPVLGNVGVAPPEVAELKSIGLSAGLDAIGVTTAEPFEATLAEILRRREAGLHADMQFTFRNPERSTDPGRILEGARSIIVGAMRVSAPRLPDAGPGRARIAAYARHDHYGDLRAALEVVAGRLIAASCTARVVADNNSLVDRAAAVRAGIGWFGRNGNVLIPGHGSWFVLGSVVTDAALPADQEVVADGCGTCRSCIDGCPTGAIVEPGVIDARRCLAWLVQAPGDIPLEFRKAMGGRIYGCDDCQEVCPVGRADRSAEGSTDTAADVEAVEVLAAADDDLLARFGRWYIAERDPRYLRRNALVVLGNTADANDPLVVRALTENLNASDPMLRGHAEWAALELDRADLLDGSIR
ncbi:MAG: tRNA epoxyqueuosine(34) reductase QueG [Acidimicrobiales bacterium]|nr:tRNA epoxyqueuosine(34) reductase QueG [Acidimicrobiales bacterium]MDP7210064.1 tRNA epoxyqueuosine(34) reductase QueG [Acidimicrobiales bacterium]HJO98530.1 tRNA epoxyqueuosine(34) reductase QueG [Acidimicrobiales bacterium]